jgi:ParB family chromosome partitioning protein
MAYDYKIIETRRIPLENMVIGKGQVRKHHVAKDIHELADSIRVVGQLQPIVVAEFADRPGKYEILTGQRRFLACKELGQKDMLAMVLDHPIPETEAQVISFTENLVKHDPDPGDYVDICNHLFKIYGDVATIADRTGLPPKKVREYVKYASLIPELREMVDKGVGGGGIDQRIAVRIQRALEATGEVKKDTAIALANKMKGLVPAQRDRLVKEVEAAGVATVADVDEVAESVKKAKTYIQMRVRVDQEVHRALTKYALKEGIEREDAAQSLITEALQERGFLNEYEE